MKCINDPKRSYNGKEPSPKGFGYCAHAERVGATKKGKDGNRWTVKKDKLGRKRWVRNATKAVSKGVANKKAVSKRVANKKAAPKLAAKITANIFTHDVGYYGYRVQIHGDISTKYTTVDVMDQGTKELYLGKPTLSKYRHTHAQLRTTYPITIMNGVDSKSVVVRTSATTYWAILGTCILTFKMPPTDRIVNTTVLIEEGEIYHFLSTSNDYIYVLELGLKFPFKGAVTKHVFDYMAKNCDSATRIGSRINDRLWVH